ncbi:FtsX-like permease family protein [Niastella caeni]|uniref:FtsX-like permease family protein n=1 Tax=Niastella caeni TaxID=2569763 RepID=A0A4S8I0A4_9BACT|nr:ABC transporter permease [Niastella caeni]THU40579.1 FtsX-like permease family protein [Niastella caeni]
MFLNYIKIAWRHLWKNKTFSAINITGLSMGIACALLIILHIKNEINYDKGFTKSDRIFRVTLENIGENERHWAPISFPAGAEMQRYFPQVEKMARFYRPYPFQVFSYATTQGTINKFEEKAGFFADAAAINIFDIPFSRGNAQTALSATNSIVLTEKMARKYFGDEDPVGKVIQEDLNKVPFTVTGVVRSFPFPSHLQFDYLLSIPTIQQYQDQRSLENRTWSAFYTYVLLNEKASKTTVEARFPNYMLGFYKPTGETPNEILTSRKLHLQPVADIHLHSKLEKEMSANSDIRYVYIFSIIAVFILLVAAVNFINISTALAFNRMKEIGLRKVAGATKQQLLRQFMGESFLITMLSALVALLLIKAALPLYAWLTEKDIRFEELFTLSNLALLLLLILCCGLLAGCYPAWFVANFNPINSMKGKKDTRFSLNFVRKGLIIFQFAVSVFMIFSTIIVYQQMRFFHNKNMGFDKEQVVAITMYGSMWQHFSALINNIKKNPAISNFSVVSTLPGDRFSMQPFFPANETEDDQPSCRIMWADNRLLPTLKIALKEGRNFVNQFPDIKNKEFILNETTVKAYGLTNAIGKKFILDRDTGEIVGVIKDFNFASLHSAVEPLVIKYDPYRANYLLVKVQPHQMPKTLQFLESNIKSLSPESTFTYTFIDEKMKRLYEAENQLSRVFKVFAVFVIFISCLGLFGLSAYSTQLRTREIGIRKVLGASVSNVTFLLLKDFMVLVLTGIVLSWPFAWWAMTRWLDGFAYRIPIDGWVFTLSGVLSLTGALVTVSYQAIKAALLNPVVSLKTE